MTRYINADELIKSCDRVINFGIADKDGEHSVSVEVVKKKIESLPTANIRENRKGNWKTSYVPSKDEIVLEYCSECEWGKMIEEKRKYNFCPNCGASMWKEVEKDEPKRIKEKTTS